jgi:hypothetical protein
MAHIKIHRITTETKIIYALSAFVFAVVLLYFFLIASTMIFTVQKKSAEQAIQTLKRTLADREAFYLDSAASFTMADAIEKGFVRVAERTTASGEVLLGRLGI